MTTTTTATTMTCPIRLCLVCFLNETPEMSQCDDHGWRMNTSFWLVGLSLAPCPPAGLKRVTLTCPQFCAGFGCWCGLHHDTGRSKMTCGGGQRVGFKGITWGGGILQQHCTSCCVLACSRAEEQWRVSGGQVVSQSHAAVQHPGRLRLTETLNPLILIVFIYYSDTRKGFTWDSF